MDEESSPGGASTIRRATGGSRPSADGGWWATLGVSAVVLGAIGADVTADIAAGAELSHVLVESISVGTAAAGLGVAVLRLLRSRADARAEARAALGEADRARLAAAQARDEAATRSQELDRVRAEAEAFRAASRSGAEAVARAVREQMGRWGLTAAETEVARLLLLGLSMKDIAVARGTSERTAREQAQAVYRKGRLAGRAELSAFFLEDLLPTAED